MLILSRKVGTGFRVGHLVFEVLDIDPDMGVLFKYRPQDVPSDCNLFWIAFDESKAIPESDVTLYANRPYWIRFASGKVSRKQVRIGIEAPLEVLIPS